MTPTTAPRITAILTGIPRGLVDVTKWTSAIRAQTSITARTMDAIRTVHPGIPTQAVRRGVSATRIMANARTPTTALKTCVRQTREAMETGVRIQMNPGDATMVFLVPTIGVILDRGRGGPV